MPFTPGSGQVVILRQKLKKMQKGGNAYECLLLFTQTFYIIKGELYGAQTVTMASGISGRAAD
jgi:hypothetical protein